jgi:hypothetical protein
MAGPKAGHETGDTPEAIQGPAAPSGRGLTAVRLWDGGGGHPSVRVAPGPSRDGGYPTALDSFTF